MTIMDNGPAKALLPGNRLHLQHGPIDLVIKAEGPPDAVESAYGSAEERFRTILPELVSELPLLRRPARNDQGPTTPVARRMWRAATRFPGKFITPMGAVAGSVADEIIDVMVEGATGLRKVFVNNGGDIALWKTDGEQFSIDLATYPELPAGHGRRPVTIRINGSGKIGGVATSGRHGRSFSLGIADAVTVLADNAAIADACATLVANSVDIDGAEVRRMPASELDLDSDLGERLVTVEVGPLEQEECDIALDKGVTQAQEFLNEGLVNNVFLLLQDNCRFVPDDLKITRLNENEQSL